MEQTIAAVATAPGSGGIAVVRVSGPDAVAVADRLLASPLLARTESRHARLVTLRNDDGSPLDEAVALVMRAPASFTGEDTVELSLHGSPYIQSEVLRLLCANGARIARPGEFSQRAFLNGKMDLAQAEGVADLIAAQSRAAHRLAFSQLRGNFSQRFGQLRQQLIDFASLLELELDFSEEDVEFADRSRLRELCLEAKRQIDALATSFRAGNAFKKGVPVAIVGRPNAGKSTLLNRLLSDDKAIVSPIAGTTRDTVEDLITIRGILFRLIDTAGLRDATEAIERLGIERTRAAMERASIVVWLLDPTAGLQEQVAEMEAFRQEIKEWQALMPVMVKRDLCPSVAASCDSHGPGDDMLHISALTGEGVEQLGEALAGQASQGWNPDQDVMVSNERHHEALLRSSEALARALEGLESGLSADFVAQDVREATSHLAEITGAITTSDLLQTVFSRFCIGK